MFWMTMRTLYLLGRTPAKDWLPFLQRKCEKLSALLRSRSTENGQRELEIERLEQAMFQAVAHYTVRNYPGRILNIVASKRNLRDSRYAWTDVAAEGCQTVDVAAMRTGDLLVSPHVEEISSQIQHFIAAGSHDKTIRPSSEVVA
jgi:hypothetical protein